MSIEQPNEERQSAESTNRDSHVAPGAAHDGIGPQTQPPFCDREHPLEWIGSGSCPWPKLPDLVGYKQCAPWQRQSASERQLGYIRNLGMKPTRSLTQGEASFLIGGAETFETLYPSPATEKQRQFLDACGLWEMGLTKKEASAIIAEYCQRHGRSA